MPKPHLRRRLARLASVLLPAVLFSLVPMAPIASSAASAQEAAPAAGEETAAPTTRKVKPIPIGEIGVESERSKSKMADIGESISVNEELEALASQLPALKRKVDDQLAMSSEARESDASPYDLDRLEAGWGDVRSDLARVQAELRSRGQAIEAQLETIRRVAERWEATRKEAVSQQVNPEVIDQISEVERAIELAMSKGSKRQAEIVGIQSEVARLDETASGDVKKVRDQREVLIGTLWQRDASPVWAGGFWHEVSTDEILERVGEQLTRQREMMSEYWRKNRDGLTAYAVLVVAMFAGMLAIRRGIHRRFDEEEELAPIRAIFDHPVALTLLMSTYLGYFISPAATRAFGTIVGPAMLLPAVVILRSIVDRPLFPILNAVVGLFFVGQIIDFVQSLPNLPRFLVMLEMLFIATFIVAWKRPSRLAALPRDMTTGLAFRMIGIGLWIALILSLIAFFAEFSGFRGLARQLGGSLVRASFSAVVIYGATRVLDGVFAYLLRIRPLRLLGMVSRHRWLIRTRGLKVLQALGWYVWATVTLRNAQLLDDVEESFGALMERELPFAEVSVTVGDILACVLTFWFAMLVSRFIRFLLEEDVYTRVRLSKGSPYAITTLLHYSILMIGFTLALAALGFDLNRFTLLAGAFGVGIGFGLQTIVNNFISGIILLTERPIQVGDTIALGSGSEVFGEVGRIGIRSSTVRTWQGAEVIVPNADLISGQVTNWTLSDRRRRLEVPVGVAYGSEPKHVLEILLSVVRGREHILEEPEPYILFMGFGESSLDFEVRAWTDEFDSYQRVRSELCVAISDALREAGLQIPFPQRDLHVKTITEQSANALAGPSEDRPADDAPPVRKETDGRRVG